VARWPDLKSDYFSAVHQAFFNFMSEIPASRYKLVWPFTKNRSPFTQPPATFAVKKFASGEKATSAAPHAQGSTPKSRRNQEIDL
jgi:hypothetical protein